MSAQPADIAAGPIDMTNLSGFALVATPAARALRETVAALRHDHQECVTAHEHYVEVAHRSWVRRREVDDLTAQVATLTAENDQLRAALRDAGVSA